MRRNICNKNENFPKNFQIIPDSQTVIASQNFRIAHFPFPFSKEIVLSPFLSFFSLADHPGQAITSFFPFLHFFPSLSFFPLSSPSTGSLAIGGNRERERKRPFLVLHGSPRVSSLAVSLYIYNRTHTHTRYTYTSRPFFSAPGNHGLGWVRLRRGQGPLLLP